MHHRLLYILLLTLLLIGCDSNNNSSVPSAAVQLTINTDDAPFVNYVPDNRCWCFTLENDGYHRENGDWFAARGNERYGYAGVVVICDGYGNLSAYDLCCPRCLNPRVHAYVDSYSRIICPLCGEEYSTLTKYDAGCPTRGISKEPLRSYHVRYITPLMTVSN